MYILLEGRCKTKKNRDKNAPRAWLTLFRLEKETTFNTRQLKAVNNLFSSDKAAV